MSAFNLLCGHAVYFYVQHSEQPRYPYGVCGPFATDTEADAALERIESVFPAVVLHIERGMFADDVREMLATDNARARQRLEQLRA